MKINNAAITFLVSSDQTTIEIIDKDASITFCKIILTPEQLSMALSRLSYTPCSADVYNLHKIGKKHENEKFQFEITKELRSSNKSAELTELCIKSLAELDMAEWVPDTYFGSQDSFLSKGDKVYANATIRRWI